MLAFLIVLITYNVISALMCRFFITNTVISSLTGISTHLLESVWPHDAIWRRRFFQHRLPDNTCRGADFSSTRPCVSHIFRGQSMNSLYPISTIWWHSTESTLSRLWLVLWRHEAITWVNVDFALVFNTNETQSSVNAGLFRSGRCITLEHCIFSLKFLNDGMFVMRHAGV